MFALFLHSMFIHSTSVHLSPPLCINMEDTMKNIMGMAPAFLAHSF